MGPIYLMQPIPYFGEQLDRDNWIVEPKIDGWRMQIIRYENGKVEFWGRRLEKNPNWTDKLKNLSLIVKRFLPPGSLLDSELTEKNGRRYIPGIMANRKDLEPQIFVFDVIYFSGKNVSDLSFKERRQILESINFLPPFYLVNRLKLEGDVNRIVGMAKEKGWEGIVLKHKNSTYKVGKEAPYVTEFWKKIK